MGNPWGGSNKAEIVAGLLSQGLTGFRNCWQKGGCVHACAQTEQCIVKPSLPIGLKGTAGIETLGPSSVKPDKVPLMLENDEGWCECTQFNYDYQGLLSAHEMLRQTVVRHSIWHSITHRDTRA